MTIIASLETFQKNIFNDKCFYFAKMHGLGNDFVVLAVDQQVIHFFTTELIKKICQKNFGVGADGLMLITPSQDSNYDYGIKMFNPDGSPMGMCGNGIRCASIFAKDFLRANSFNFLVDDKTLIKTYPLNDVNQSVKVELGKYEYQPDKILRLDKDTIYKYDLVYLPNPHAVILTSDISSLDVLINIGPKIENHGDFPYRTNVEFVKVINETLIDIIVWERGAGLTQACGTGACASAISTYSKTLTKNICQVRLPGGQVLVEISDHHDTVYLTGATQSVFIGKYLL